MLTEEQFEKMELPCICVNGEIYENINVFKNHYVIYVIKNGDVFYVGLSTNFKPRLAQHICHNKNNLKCGGEVYILEVCPYYDDKQLDIMETIWISWFDANAKIINISKKGTKIKKNERIIRDIKNTNFEKFLNNEIIYWPDWPCENKTIRKTK